MAYLITFRSNEEYRITETRLGNDSLRGRPTQLSGGAAGSEAAATTAAVIASAGPEDDGQTEDTTLHSIQLQPPSSSVSLNFA